MQLQTWEEKNSQSFLLPTTNLSGRLGAETAGGAVGCLGCGFQRHSQVLETQVWCVVVLLHPQNNTQSKLKSSKDEIQENGNVIQACEMV